MTETEFCDKMITMLDAASKWFRLRAIKDPAHQDHYENKATTLGHLASSLRGDAKLGRPTLDEITAAMELRGPLKPYPKRLMKTMLWKVAM